MQNRNMKKITIMLNKNKTNLQFILKLHQFLCNTFEILRYCASFKIITSCAEVQNLRISELTKSKLNFVSQQKSINYGIY